MYQSQALTGNGPVRLSVLADPRYVATAPYAEVEAAALRVARPPLPGWENASRAVCRGKWPAPRDPGANPLVFRIKAASARPLGTAS